jgi:hypothetical protein
MSLAGGHAAVADWQLHRDRHDDRLPNAGKSKIALEVQAISPRLRLELTISEAITVTSRWDRAIVTQ